MSTPPDVEKPDLDKANKLTLLEIIGFVIMLLGLCAGILLWWTGESFSFWDGLSLGLFIALMGGLLTLVGEGFRTGKMATRGGYINRKENPKIFWAFAIVYVIIAIGFLSVFGLSLFD